MSLKQKIIIGVCIVIFALYGITKYVLPLVSELSAQSSPVTKIEVVNKKSYGRNAKIRARDFTVTAIHENGKKSKLDEDEYVLSVDTPALTGNTTEVEIIYKENDKITVKIHVKNDREPVMRFYCGRKELKDVTAVLYSNGELCFEGNGDVLTFHDYPWNNYEDMDDNPIQAVTFEGSVKPKSMDHWFDNMNTLISVPLIPDSVESMEGTFEDCESLKEGSNWSKCKRLLNVKDCFKGCVRLEKITELPESVIVAESMCEGCTSLVSTSDLTRADSLINANTMYKGCASLIDASTGPNTELMKSTFAGCINLQRMPVIPNSVKTMERCFEEDESLVLLTNIPSSVENISSCFAKCGKIRGELVIDANPANYSNLFTEAAVATKVEISGASEMMNLIVEEAENSNIRKK